MDGRWMQSFQRPPSTFLLIPDGRIRDHCRSETIVNEKKGKTNGRLASPLAPQQCGALSRQRGDRASESPHDLGGTWRAVTSLASRLKSAGLERGDRLGVFLDASIPQALSIFAASAADVEPAFRGEGDAFERQILGAISRR